MRLQMEIKMRLQMERKKNVTADETKSCRAYVRWRQLCVYAHYSNETADRDPSHVWVATINRLLNIIGLFCSVKEPIKTTFIVISFIGLFCKRDL